jgi:hypothetical protein
MFAANPFDPALLARKPVAAKVTLEKLLAAPASYSSQVVVPAGMYHLARSRVDDPGGARKFLVTERNIVQKARGLDMTSSFFTELEVEPRLAEHLDGLAPAQLRDKVAILTLWVTGVGTCGLVKVDLLEKVTPRIKKGYLGQADLVYETLQMTPEGSRTARADDADWEQLGRMLHFANVYKGRFKAYRRMVRDSEAAQIGAQMNSMFGQMMRGVAQAEQQRMIRERAVGGR